MAQWERLFLASECGPGRQRFVSVGGVELAVFHLAGGRGFVAVANSCPHAGGNLSAGVVEDAVVTCPWHQWRFDLHSGACVENEQVRVLRFPLRIEDGWVTVNLEDAERPPPDLSI
ncbi:MAG: Rieske (2Fe-2S) protein [Phycisphaerae bacterium]